MRKLNRVASLMAAAAISSLAVAGQAVGNIGGAPNAPSPIKAPKTKEPSASKGGRAYGRNKHGNTGAFVRAARKARNVRRHHNACK